MESAQRDADRVRCDFARADAIVESENADIVHLGGSDMAQSERSDIALNGNVRTGQQDSGTYRSGPVA